MGDTTHISWADMTMNWWIGCTKVSDACTGCYAEHLMDTRHHRVTWGKPGQAGTLSLTSEANRRKPLMWNRKAAAAGTRPFVFCSSLSDVFDKNALKEWRRELFATIRATPNLVWLLLTKRPQNMIEMTQEAGGLPPNAALGTTVEDQIRANLNVPHLCEAKMALNPLFTFLSCEPLLGEIYLRAMEVKAGRFNFLRESHTMFDPLHPTAPWKIGWIITGGETDQGAHKARPTHPNAYRFLRDQAAATATPFHHKQNGEWIGGDQIPDEETIPSGISNDCGYGSTDDNLRVWRVGKARSGRMLDGVIHDARPILPALAQALL